MGSEEAMSEALDASSPRGSMAERGSEAGGGIGDAGGGPVVWDAEVQRELAEMRDAAVASYRARVEEILVAAARKKVALLKERMSWPALPTARSQVADGNAPTRRRGRPRKVVGSDPRSCREIVLDLLRSRAGTVRGIEIVGTVQAAGMTRAAWYKIRARLTSEGLIVAVGDGFELASAVTGNDAPAMRSEAGGAASAVTAPPPFRS